jgi:hypothetical protein
MAVPGTQRSIMVHRLMAFTGTRFVNAMAIRDQMSSGNEAQAPVAAANQACTSGDSSLPAAKRPRLDSPVGPALKDSAAQLSTAPAPYSAQRSGKAERSPSSPGAAAGGPDAGALNRLLDIFSGVAPEDLSVRDALALVDAANFCMADAVLEQLPAYWAPMLRRAPYAEVRSWPCCF